MSSNPPEKSKRKYQVFFYDAYCKGCGICSELCKRQALRISDRLGPLGYFVAEVDDEDLCNGCRFCEVSCPDMAITVTERGR